MPPKRRDRHGRPHRQRRDDRHPLPPRLHQAHARQPNTDCKAAAARASRAWRPARPPSEDEADDFIEHLFSARRTITCCSSPTPAAFMSSACMKSPKARAPRKGRSIKNVLNLQPRGKNRRAAPPRSAGRTRTARHHLPRGTGYVFFATQRQGEEDRPQRIPQLPQGRHHRHQPRGRKRPHRRACSPTATMKSSSSPTKACASASTRRRRSRIAESPPHRPQHRRRARHPLDADDYLVSCITNEPDTMLLVVSENGLGKRTPFDDYRSHQSRRQRHDHHEGHRQNRQGRRRARRA